MCKSDHHPSRNEINVYHLFMWGGFLFIEMGYYGTQKGYWGFVFILRRAKCPNIRTSKITHTNANFKEIPSGVLNILAKITSRMHENSKMTSRKKYPNHVMALNKAWLD